MVAIRKKFFVSALKLVALMVSLCGVVYAIRSLDSSWQDERTWSVSDTVVLPKNTKNLNIIKDQQGNTITFSVPYCTLYKITVNDDTREYYCSLLPWYSWQRFQYDPKLASEENQIVLKVPKNAPAPMQYLGRLDLSASSLDSIGSTPIPVSLKLSFTTTRPDKNLVSEFTHWRKSSIGVPEETKQTVVSWEVNKIAAYEELTSAQKKQFAADFGKGVLEFFNQKVGLQDKLQNAKTTKTYLMALFNIFKYGSYNCSKGLTEYNCDLGYEQNPAESIMYYYYLTHNTKLSESMKQQILGHMWPFQSETSSAVDTCPDRGNCDSYYDYTMYQYQVCPRIALHQNDYDDSIFMNYYVARAPDFDSLMSLKTEAAGLASGQRSTSLELYTLRRNAIKAFSNRINAVCYSLIKAHAPQKDFDELRALSYPALWFDFVYADFSGEIKQVNEENLEAFAYYAKVTQPYNTQLLPNYTFSMSTSFTGVSDKSYEQDMHVSFDIIHSLMLSYLIAPND